MCGINGIITKKPVSDIGTIVEKMNGYIVHRGPDDNGVYTSRNEVAMGMQRLAIIDLSTGNQPFYNDDRSLAIVFNGEIYNYLNLKLQLEQQGVLFKTSSDTEVLLKLYELHGPDCLAMLNGMFAFSIHDQRRDTVFIARDRFGEKPLYYHHSDDRLIFASELKSIINLFPELKKISTDALNLFFALTYIPAPHTIYQDVWKLQPGHFIEISLKTLKKKITCYWDINLSRYTGPAISYDEAKQRVEQLLTESVTQRMIADVPLGVFLSGGVDSTIIAAIMARHSTEKIKTFSVGFHNKKYDESDRARTIARHIGSDHHEYILDYKDLYNEVNAIVLNYDEPYADSSCLPTYFISKQTAKMVKVALTGDGGDEVFGGYNKYLAIRYRNLYKKYIPDFLRKALHSEAITSGLEGRSGKSVLGKAHKLLASIDDDAISSHMNIIALGFRTSDLQRLINPEWRRDYKAILQPQLQALDTPADELKQIRYIDKVVSLEGDMLVKVDRASMLCSLECRAPFLDHRLMELTYQLPDEYLIKGGNKKRILKDTFEHLLPPGFFNAPKSGFEIPVGDWFRGDMKQELDKMLSVEKLGRHGLLNVAYVRSLFTEHTENKADHSWKLWTIYCFQKWYHCIFI
jgi:asparagine synthase (glutamine-hydrolysing)